MTSASLNNGYLTARISQSALEHNIRTLRQHLESETKICGVVKADCYGHGWEPCLPIIAEHVDFLAVATLDEAKNVAQRDLRPEVLAFSVPAAASQDRLAEVIQLGVVLTVTSFADLQSVGKAAATADRIAKVHVKVDSGMARSGVWFENAIELIEHARAHRNIALTGLYTHFASADESDKQPTHHQFERFSKVIQSAGGRDELLLHANNSAATIDLPEYQLDMVRPGMAIYGYQPSAEIKNRLDLRPILKLIGRLVAIKSVPSGTRVGYGRSYQCDREQSLGLVQVGYADGYRRAFSNRANMLLRGQRVPVRGNVSMDQTVVDISEVDNAKIGDMIEIISPDVSAPNSVGSLAEMAGLIPYEVICGLGDRIERTLVE